VETLRRRHHAGLHGDARESGLDQNIVLEWIGHVGLLALGRDRGSLNVASDATMSSALPFCFLPMLPAAPWFFTRAAAAKTE
jgi:hypothetical protein